MRINDLKFILTLLTAEWPLLTPRRFTEDIGQEGRFGIWSVLKWEMKYLHLDIDFKRAVPKIIGCPFAKIHRTEEAFYKEGLIDARKTLRETGKWSTRILLPNGCSFPTFKSLLSVTDAS